MNNEHQNVYDLKGKEDIVIIGSRSLATKPSVPNLCFEIDTDFKLDKQTNYVVKSSFYQLWFLSQIKH